MIKTIEVKNLVKDYGSGRGVFDVSFFVKKGEVYGFLGPNGAGKSTTIRHLMGFSKPDKGETLINGKETFNHYSEVLKDVGYIPGEIAFPAGLTGEELIDMLLTMKKAKEHNRLPELLELFQLDEVTLKQETKRMSLGVKRKLAIVTAFMTDPDILILDEPTSGLDPKMQEVFIDYILKEKERGKTILLSSHIFSEVDQTCDRIGIIKEGKLVSEFISNDLKHAENKLYKIQFAPSDYKKIKSELENIDFVNVIHDYADKKALLLVIHESNTNEFLKLLTHYHVTDFVSKNETLEDYFMKFYKSDKNFKGAL